MAVSYNKLNMILDEKGMSMAELRKAANIAPNTMTRFRKNQIVSTDVLCRVCEVLNTDFGDIIEYTPESK